MSYLAHVNAANRHDMADYLPWYVGEFIVGYVTHDLAQALAGFSDTFQPRADGFSLNPSLASVEERSLAVEAVLADLRAAGQIKPAHGELYSVAPRPRGSELMRMDRAAVTPFGTVNEGFHLNGFVRKAGEFHIWVARRSAEKSTYPGMLDNMVAGGQPYNVSVAENVIKECKEEADIPPELAGKAIPVGAISYLMGTDEGLRRHTMYVYDLEVTEDFTPRPFDGEVSEFQLLPIAEVARLVRDTGAFKYNCNLAIIDFLIRHGMLTPDEPDYAEIVCGLRRRPF